MGATVSEQLLPATYPETAMFVSLSAIMVVPLSSVVRTTPNLDEDDTLTVSRMSSAARTWTAPSWTGGMARPSRLSSSA